MDYPSNWKPETDGADVSFGSGNGNVAIFYDDNLSGTADNLDAYTDLNSAGLTVDRLNKNASPSREVSAVMLDSKNKTTINGNPGYSVLAKMTLKANGEIVFLKRYYFYKNGKGYTVQTTASKTHIEEVASTFEKMVNSFRIK